MYVALYIMPLKIISENSKIFEVDESVRLLFEMGRGPFHQLQIIYCTLNLFVHILEIYIIYSQFNFHNKISFCMITGQ